MKLAVVGIGLIGGSMARDLRKAGWATEIAGVEKNQAHAAEALKLQLVDKIISLQEAASWADVIILSVPVNVLHQVVPVVLQQGTRATVVDVGSTKSQICKAVANHPVRAHFVAAHPIAGTENSGPSAALDNLFTGKTNIICEREKTAAENLMVALAMFETLGMTTIFMEPEEHDRHVAYVSHLSHVSSFLLGQTVLDIERDVKNIFNLAGSGFASTVRLAKSSPDMWVPIFDQNLEYLSQALLEYIMHLQRFHYHLMKRDTRELHRILANANQIRGILDGMEQKKSTT
jgi:prephenate dehydrogenase